MELQAVRNKLSALGNFQPSPACGSHEPTDCFNLELAARGGAGEGGLRTQ